jgi:hypothetical protein
MASSSNIERIASRTDVLELPRLTPFRVTNRVTAGLLAPDASAPDQWAPPMKPSTNSRNEVCRTPKVALITSMSSIES